MVDYKTEIINTLKSTNRKGIDDLINYLTSKTDFFTAPASTKYHSNFEGGLCEHSWKVRETLNYKNKYFNLGIKQESVDICAICHDICKCNFYKKIFKSVKEGTKIKYGKEVANWVDKEVWEVDDTLPLGHGEKSIIILQRFIPLSEFEVLAIRWHMGCPDDYESKMAFNKAVEKYPSIIILHTADIESSHLLETTNK